LKKELMKSYLHDKVNMQNYGIHKLMDLYISIIAYSIITSK
jgi:hypothetical protein